MRAPDWGIPSVRSGIRRMLDRRSELIASGERMIGWKLAFGAPVWLDRFGLTGPLVGYLPGSKSHSPGATVSCVGWAHPVAEPEIALLIGRDIDDPERAAQSISGLGAAIELANVDSPPDDLELVLAGNIFHRAVILGQPNLAFVDGSSEGLRAIVTRHGHTLADTTELETLTGDLVTILGHTATLLAAAGEKLRSGEVVIMGSIIPPVSTQPGDEITFRLDPLAPISVRV